jgi:hypothetical protein
MRLWITNISPGTTDGDLQAFLEKHGLPPFEDALPVPGDGSRPGVLLTFAGASAEMLNRAADPLNGVYWKARPVAVRVLLR